METRLFSGVAVALCGLLLMTVCARDIFPPIPVALKPHGLRYLPAEPRPQVQLEIFIDLHCPDSQFGWNLVKGVREHYGPAKLDLVVQQMPLPYHRNAFLATQGLYVIMNSAVSSQVFRYIEESLLLWRNFSTSGTLNKTETEVLDMIADMAVNTTGIEKAHFISTIDSHWNDARIAWKFAAKRGVAGTPAFFVNHVDLVTSADLNTLPTQQEWITFLDPIINPTNK